MATTIITKNGSGAPLAGDLTAGELAVDLTNKRLYSKDSGGNVIELGTNAGSSTFADLTVSGDLTVDTNTLYVDSTNNRVGIGTSSPSEALTVSGSGTSARISLTDSDSVRASMTGFLEFDGTDNRAGFIGYDAGNMSLYAAVGDIKLSTGGAERMRLDSSGNLLVGTTSSPFSLISAASTNGIAFEGVTPYAVISRTDSNSACLYLNKGTYTSGTELFQSFHTGSTTRGSIDYNGTQVNYNTTSDQRLKENITDAPAGNIDDIRIRSFDWKESGEHQKYGVIAQELLTAAPEAVSQGATDEDMWGVDYSKLVPMMIKEIQDLKAEVAALKGAN